MEKYYSVLNKNRDFFEDICRFLGINKETETFIQRSDYTLPRKRANTSELEHGSSVKNYVVLNKNRDFFFEDTCRFCQAGMFLICILTISSEKQH